MNTVRSEPLKDNNRSVARGRFSYNRLAGAGTWAIGCFLTYLFLRTFEGDPLGLAGAIIAAIVAQVLLTMAERPLWRWIFRRSGGKLVLVGFVITLVDGALNAGGLYPFLGALSGTNVVTMFTDVFSIAPTVGKTTALALALVLGLTVAGLAEYFWEMD